jgi:hypothetical protein
MSLSSLGLELSLSDHFASIVADVLLKDLCDHTSKSGLGALPISHSAVYIVFVHPTV